MGRTLALCRTALFLAILIGLLSLSLFAQDVVKVSNGSLSGTKNADGSVRMFRAVPFAAAPVGDLRWKAPQPAPNWKGVRDASKFGPACLQNRVFNDIVFRGGPSNEDCLTVDILVPAKASKNTPVYLWYYGGGFAAGGSSEPRYDGESLAKKGIIVVNANYRLGIFGFYSHPELTKESPHHASGNYGLLDQVAALEWVKKNIAAFGGDPNNITIGGESAGSFSVSALMASPLSRKLFQKAIGESGAFFSYRKEGTLSQQTLADSEAQGVKFAESLGARSLADMRAKSGQELLDATAKSNAGFGFRPNIDGYFLPERPEAIFARGDQARVPLLAGWNADEASIGVVASPEKPTVASWKEMAEKRLGPRAAEFLKLYPANTDAQALQSAKDASGDDFIGYSTWKWLDVQGATQPKVFAYHFEQVPAAAPGEMVGPIPAKEAGARHAGEIEYAFDSLRLEDKPWTQEDRKVADAMTTFWSNFVKTGDPNGAGVPKWPTYTKADGYAIMHLSGTNLGATPHAERDRYLFLDSLKNEPPATQPAAAAPDTKK